MKSKSKAAALQKRSDSPSGRGRRHVWLRSAGFLVGGLLLCGAAIMAVPAGRDCVRNILFHGQGRSDPDQDRPQFGSLNALLAARPEDLSRVDVALMNLLCAEGLPGAEKLDISKCLATLDMWAARVRMETGRHEYRATDPKWADHYRHSVSYLRAEMLVQVLQEDFKVHYNLERMRKVDFTNSKDLFIHGLIDDANGGTCCSMPALYVAVGRRLGYPLKLVLGKAHVFVRWDDPVTKERFNIEATAGGGMDSPDDSHYRTWPEPMTEADRLSGRYLKSLSPAEEFAMFLASRGHCLLDTGRVVEAKDAYGQAVRLAPGDPEYQGWLKLAARSLSAAPRSRQQGGTSGPKPQGN